MLPVFGVTGAGGGAAAHATTVRPHRTSESCDHQLRRAGFRPPSRVHLLAPARWKATDARTRLHGVDWATVIPVVPVRRTRAAVVPRRTEVADRLSPTDPWLLPPLWPLDDWHGSLLVHARRMVGGWSLLLTRMAGRRRLRPRLLFGAAMVAAAVMVVLLTRAGPPAQRALVSSKPSSSVPAAQRPPLSRVLVQPVRSLALSSPVASPLVIPGVIASAALSAPVVTAREPWTDVSTMDLMMPIAEPDLDISSHTSLWSQVGKSAGVDPLLLYSIALVESKALYPNGKLAPTPWLFRVNNHLVRGDRQDVQLAMAAASQFGSAVQDVGIMQVYYPMHRDAVRDPLTLLNPRTNIAVAAKILHDGMHQTRDPVLGVGYYHSHTPSLARDYGTAVLTVYQRLKAIHRSTARGTTVAR
ncbi:MAG: hypothetical protein ABI870_11725 [Rhodanobacter sp.]